MNANLLIFLDGFPYSNMPSAEYLNSFTFKKQLTPGLGFSINIKPEIYAGLEPDEIGYFGEFAPRSEPPQTWEKRVGALHELYRWPLADRTLHKVFIRLGYDVLNIPFGYLQFFAPTKKSSVYDQAFPFPTLFSLTDTTYIAAEKMDRRKGPRDLQVFQQAMVRIKKEQNLHLSFMGLDEAGHNYGVGTKKYIQVINELNVYVQQLSEAFSATHPDGTVVIFSDHGMTNVEQSVRVILEKDLGPAGPTTYLYFIDSVMLRVWVYNEALNGKVEELLSGFQHGTLLSPTDRSQFGATRSFCGDYILILDEGKIFSPSFFGLKEPRAMHGYLPHLPSQQGIFLAKGPRVKQNAFAGVRNTRDLFGFLSSLH